MNYADYVVDAINWGCMNNEIHKIFSLHGEWVGIKFDFLHSLRFLSTSYCLAKGDVDKKSVSMCSMFRTNAFHNVCETISVKASKDN